MNSGGITTPRPGTLTVAQVRAALARAEQRRDANRGPEDLALAVKMVKRYRTRLAGMELVRCQVCNGRHGRERCPWCERETAG